MSMENEVNAAVDLAEQMMPKIAKIVGVFRDELIKNGFTREEAIVICSKYKMSA